MQEELPVLQHAGAVLSPLERAAGYLGAPYRLHGRTEQGWDCWGCVAALRAKLFERPTPSWADAYTPLDGVTPVALADTAARLITERLAAWRPVAPAPGAVALFSLFGRPAHVGLLLTPTDFIHALGGCDTAIERLSAPRWAPRLIGCFDA